MVTHPGALKLWKSGECATLPTCNSLLAKISKVLVFVSVFDAMVLTFFALIFGRALLFHFGTHEAASLQALL
eukprot:s2032_g13.t1